MKTRFRFRPAAVCLLLALALLLASALPCLAAGSFRLVGIGPGDLDLMTPRQIKAIQEADIVFCRDKTKTRLASKIDFAAKQTIDDYGLAFWFYGRDCAQVPAHKKIRWGMTCEEFQQKRAEFLSLVRQAVAQGKKVVMTTDGDPTIYGPCIWTVLELGDIDAKVIPGISSFNAANAALKASLGEVILTAPLLDSADRDTIESLAVHDRAVMVIFMPRDFNKLIPRLAKVYAPDTPLAVISRAGQRDKEKVVLGTVGDIGPKLAKTDPKMSLLYVGKTRSKPQYRPHEPKTPGSGKFYLVGMGPGDPDLASLRALQVIEKADLIFANARIQERYASQLEGKKVLTGYNRLFPFYDQKCGQPSKFSKTIADMSCEDYHRKQAEFAALTRRAVAQGKTVAMLDSGDPLVYGPCAWTITELSDLNTEVVPGMSCFNAANAALGKSVTGGSDTHSVLLASGWSVAQMAPHKATMALFTMRNKLEKFVQILLKSYGPQTPVAIVFNAGFNQKEKVLQSTLGGVLKEVQGQKLPFYHMLYVGDFLTNRNPY